MEEREDEVFAGDERLTTVGQHLQSGDAAPDFRLDYLDLADGTIHTVGLADSSGMVRLLNVVNTLATPICQKVARRWEACCATLPSNTCIYTVSMDLPQMQARWQDATGVMHQALSAYRSERFGRDYGVWLKQWRLLQMAVFIIDQHDYIVYTEYIADQLHEPDYEAAIRAIHKVSR